MNCDLQYALVPRKPVIEMVRDRAKLKAKKLVNKVHVHMALESQELTNEKLQEQVEIEVDRLMREMPRDLWED